jgi:superfamily II DNA or RNA helicase
MSVLTDAAVRDALIEQSFEDAIAERPAADDVSVAWLSGLLGSREAVPPCEAAGDLLHEARAWVSRLDETGEGRSLRLCFRLSPPIDLPLFDAMQPPEDAEAIWPLTLHLRAADDPDWLIDVARLWNDPAAAQLPGGGVARNAEELVLAELGRAGTIYPRLEAALAATIPAAIELRTDEAYAFLREYRALLEESGFDVIVPPWWETHAARLGMRLVIDAPESGGSEEPGASGGGGGAGGTGGTGGAGASLLGLDSLVRYRWEVAVGSARLSADDLARLEKAGAPLVRLRGQWVELSRDDLAAASRLARERPGGRMTLLEAMQYGHGAAESKLGLPVLGLDCGGWVASVLGASTDPRQMPRLRQPEAFRGTLRPYQENGLSWLAFLNRYGFGACLADDMGLGKTIQLIALLLHEREDSTRTNGPAATLPPTLLIVPTSLVENWARELARFAPSLRVHVRHGPDRPAGDRFAAIARDSDVVITTYALVTRDRETLAQVLWRRVVLDEAQYIKNPPTKQTTAIRSLRAERRIALTGTPVENRLSELWSIMEFCNPGYLGQAGEFRRRFSIPVERHRDRAQAERLRAIVRPFILRRLKTDPTVIDDLPPCVETREYATLTPEQAAIYQGLVSSMLGEIDRAEGMQRRGLVLAALMKLKQVCNHPAQLLRESPGPEAGAEPLAAATASPQSLVARSGKCRRLVTLLEEALAAGDRALVFTQFRQMGHLLVAMLQHDLDCEALFLHGGTPQPRRQQMIDRFQSPGGPPIFVLSLKAGGVGLNLTAANHVFHFDRWWNPAVENQATDRAFRIGQTRTVHVHKFVCVGTLEERIDQMIEQKTELAQNIVGAGEDWLTELSSRQLRDLLALRDTAMEEDS